MINLENYKMFYECKTDIKDLENEDILFIYDRFLNSVGYIEKNKISSLNTFYTNMYYRNFIYIKLPMFYNRYFSVYPFLKNKMDYLFLETYKTTIFSYNNISGNGDNSSFITVPEYINKVLWLKFYYKDNLNQFTRIGEFHRQPFLYSLKHKLEDRINKECIQYIDNTDNITLRENNFVNNISNGCNFNLFEYQKNDIMWIKDIEKKIDTNELSFTYIYNNLLYSNDLEFCMVNNKICFDKTHAINEKKEKKVNVKGGNLISEVGLGKTLIMLFYIFNKTSSRVLKDNCNHVYVRGGKIGEFCKNSKKNAFFCATHINEYPIKINYELTSRSKAGTLLIAPNGLCKQWLQECYTKFNILTLNKSILYITNMDQFNVITHDDILNADLVIVSLNMICRVDRFFTKIKWERIVIDESHEITDEYCKIIKKIKSDYIWNITATPFVNGFNSYIIQMRMISDIGVFTIEDLNSDDLIKNSRHLFRKNTHKSVLHIDSENIVKQLEFTQTERNIYNSYTKDNINALIRLCCHCELNKDTNSIIKKCQTFEEVQIHLKDYYGNNIKELAEEIKENEKLLKELGDENSKNIKTHITNLKKKLQTNRGMYNYLQQTIDETNCPICLDEINEKIITLCGHNFCKNCFDTYLNSTNTTKCPSCNNIFEDDKKYYILTKTKANNELDSIVEEIKSTKLGNIIYFIKNMNIGGKIILFSQWDEMLDKIYNYFRENESCVKAFLYKGNTNCKNKSIRSFKESKETSVMLLSSKNSASGLNLTEADSVIFLEPIYGSLEYRTNTELQAIGRVKRIGQNKKIKIYRFIIKDTIEESIEDTFVI